MGEAFNQPVPSSRDIIDCFLGRGQSLVIKPLDPDFEGTDSNPIGFGTLALLGKQSDIFTLARCQKAAKRPIKFDNCFIAVCSEVPELFCSLCRC